VISIPLSPASQQSGIPNAMRQNFEDQLLLSGYEYDQRQVSPGQSLGVTLYWEALADEMRDYEVQLRLLDEGGRIMETLQERPLAGSASTVDWEPGEIVADRHDLPVNSDVPPGVYSVQVALHKVEDDERLQIVNENGRWISNKLRLAVLRVDP
jgi:hypothetical protein